VDRQLGISHGLYKIKDVAIDAARGVERPKRVSRDGSAALTLFEYSVTTDVSGASEVFTSVADQNARSAHWCWPEVVFT
jgi:hypothetical protein